MLEKNNSNKILCGIGLLLFLAIIGYVYYLLIFQATKIIIVPTIPNDEVSIRLANALIRNIRVLMGFVVFFTIVGTGVSIVLSRKLFSKRN